MRLEESKLFDLFLINEEVFRFSIIVSIWRAWFLWIYCFVDTGDGFGLGRGWIRACFFSKAFLTCRHICNWGLAWKKQSTQLSRCMR